MISSKYKVSFIILTIYSLIVIALFNFPNKFSLIGSWYFKGNTEKFTKLFNIQQTSLINYILSKYDKGKVFVTFKDNNKCSIEFLDIKKNDIYILGCEYNYNKSSNPNTISFKRIQDIEGSRHGILIFIEKNLFKISFFSSKKKFRPLVIDHENVFVKVKNKEKII